MAINVISGTDAFYGYFQQATGKIFVRAQTSKAFIYASALIDADIVPAMDSSLDIRGALWCAAIHVTDFDPLAISTFEGFPTKYKFGSYVHQDGELTGDGGYLNYIQQWLTPQLCELAPFQPSGIDFSQTSPPSPVTCDIIIPFLSGQYYAGSTAGIGQIVKSPLGLYGNGTLILDIAPSVKVDVCISYFAEAQKAYPGFNYAFTAL